MWLKLAKNLTRFSNIFRLFLRFAGSGTKNIFRTNTLKKRLFKKSQKIQFLLIFANFSTILLSKNHVLKKVGCWGGPKLICLFVFSESTCSGVSKISNHFFACTFGLTSPSA
jgi:hypothetical protein